MKKVICLCASALLLGSGSMFAQGEMDAYKFSQYDLNGTARYLSMGGAFGALGGDISAMRTNPAGLAIYRSSEIVTTVSLSSIKTKTDWLGIEMDDKKTRFNFDNIAYVGYFPTGNDEGVVGWNVGFAYNRVKNFNRQYRMGRGAGGRSISDYLAGAANLEDVTGNDLWSTDSYNPYLSQSWLPTLAYNAGLIDVNNKAVSGDFFSTMGYFDEKDNWNLLDVQSANMSVSEKGAIDKYDFSLATNISDRFFIGATVSVTDVDYRSSVLYDENFGYLNAEAQNAKFVNELFWDNYSSLDGTGYSFNLGVIARPTDFLRLGVAYNSPTWYKMTNYYSAEAGAYVFDYYLGEPNPIDPGNPDMTRQATTPTDFYTEYRLRTPDKWIFSAAAILGQNALISVDYELTNYKSMRLQDRDGYDQDADNDLIKDDFRSSGMLKVGAEYKVTPQFAIRVGGAWQNSPVQEHMKYSETGRIVEVYPAGTRTGYTVDHSINYYTVGLGYRFTPNFYVDLACVYRMQKEDVYPFPHLISDGNVLVESIPATLKTNTTKVALTLGYKF
ncbi:OmpP1/FadL family transporter [Parabacteroides johnsonii]|uniref:OmpP1/FadL family transporter n=1 Tax=Parabacteroides johnsonii TaxID=387661 RepID=UPI00242F2975|nr:outer membrane protein transport protein [Parabacteroides johnsonii]